MVGDGLVERLRAAGCAFAEDEAALLHRAASGDALEALVVRRIAGEPLEHLLGYVDFCGRRYRVSPGVFVPRQRSGLLVEEAVSLGGRTVVDLCCGCGALGLSVAARLGFVSLLGVDVSPAAVADALANGMDARVGDLFHALPPGLRGRVDLLLVNAPYVPTHAIADMPAEARDHEPRAALDGGYDGMEIQRRVLAAAPDWLAPGGHLLTETSTTQVDRLVVHATKKCLSARVVRDTARGATVLVAGVPAQAG